MGYFQILALLISPKNVLPNLELCKIIQPSNYNYRESKLQNKGENKYYPNTLPMGVWYCMGNKK